MEEGVIGLLLMIGAFLPDCKRTQLLGPELRFPPLNAALNKDSFSCLRAVGDVDRAGQDGGFEQYGSSKCQDC
jgi:hypothetical protein